jgi:hypothetical protein
VRAEIHTVVTLWHAGLCFHQGLVRTHTKHPHLVTSHHTRPLHS